MREDPCTRCGACCAAFRVDFHCSELASAAPDGVPDALTVPLTATLVRMRGTDHDIDDVRVLRQDLRQRRDHVLDSLVGREQAEAQQHHLAFDAKEVLVEARVDERE